MRPHHSPTQDPIANRTWSGASTKDNPVASLTRSSACSSPTLSAHAVARRTYPSTLVQKWALPVLDEATGQTLEYRQLRQHPDFHKVWNESYLNELCRLCQVISTSPDDTGNRVKGTNNFFLIRFEDIFVDSKKELTYTKVVCKVRPEKSDPNCKSITIGGNHINFTGDVGTPTASLNLVKLVFNSFLSLPGAKFTTFDICNFYLQNPLDRPEYV